MYPKRTIIEIAAQKDSFETKTYRCWRVGAEPIVLNTLTIFVKGTKISGGPFISIPNCQTGPFIPNKACLLALTEPGGLTSCQTGGVEDCISVALQFLAGDGTTFSVKDKRGGHLLNYYGTVNAFIIPTFGHAAIQPQDNGTVFMQVKSITRP